MAVINLGNLKFTWKGTWLPSTAYNKDDIVKHGANVYVITQAHTSGTDFLDTQQYLEIMTTGVGFIGDYSASTRYKVGDIVRFGSYSYICIQEHVSDNSTIVNPSVNTDYWDILAKGSEFQGEHANQTYSVGDIVRYGASSYICTQYNDGITPTNTAFWSKLADGFQFVGDWTQFNGYKPGDIVRNGSQLYAAITETVQGQQSDLSDDEAWFIFGVGTGFQGDYNPGASYDNGDIVRFGGNLYLALTTVSGEEPLNNPTKWRIWSEGQRSMGEWNADSTVIPYLPGDVVKYGGQFYRAKTKIENDELPDNSNVWDLWSPGFGWRGDFQLQEYYPGDVVRLGGNLYIALNTVEGLDNPPVAGIDAEDGEGNDISGQLNSNWEIYLEGISYQGQWGATTEYNVNEVVEYGGGSYICQRPNVGQQPDLDASRFDWDLLVAAPEGNVLVAEGDMIVRGGVTAQRLPIGPAGSFLYSDGTTAKWGHLTPQQTYYVSTEGDDTNDGRTPATAWRTLEHACEETYNSGQTMISVFAGTYEELTPIRVGRDVVIEGAGLGAVTVSPDNTNDKGYGVGVSKDGSTANANSDVFWMNNGARLRNIVFRGFGTGSVCVSLDPGYGPDDTSVWITSQSPYVQNCTSFTPEGTGMWVDGARHNGGYKSMVANDWTQINSDGIGIRASSDARIELVSVFTYYCNTGYLAESGAKIRSVQGSSAYGEYGVRADGFSQSETPLAATLELTDDTLLSVQTQETAAHYFDIYKDSFGNIFATGFTDPDAANIGGAWQNTSSYPLVTKFNPDGSLDWSYTYENNFGAIHSAIEIDQSIYAAGVIYDAGQDKGFLLKISKTGEIQWQKVVTDTAEFVDVATDEVYLYAVGNHATQGASVLKVNAGGTLQWSRTLDTGAGSIDTLSATSCTFAGVPTTSTDSYAAEGNANAANTLWIASRDATNSQARITLIDSTGAQTDSFVYGDAIFNDIEIDTGNGDGIYALVGGSYDDGGTERPLLARIAMTGNVAWQSQWPIAGKILRTLPFGNDVYAVGYEAGTPTRGLLARYTSAGAKDWIYELTDSTNEVALNGVALDGVNVIASGIWNDDSVLLNVQRDVQFGIGTVTTGSWAFADGTITPTNTTVIDDTQNTAYVQSLSVTLNNSGLQVNQSYSFTRTVAATRDGFAGIGTGINFAVAGLTRKPKEGSVVHIDGDTQTYFCIGVSNFDENNGTAEIALDPAVPSNKTPDDATPLVFREAFSQVRMTGHDFLDIGTGGFADTNYPVIIAEDYTQPPSQARETQGDDGGRVFYVTTDQDGNFRVGDYFKVEQATGRATLSSEEFDLSGLNELQLGSIKAGKQGATVNEFSTDGTMSGNSDNAVPTERAVVTYLTTKLASGDAVAGILQDATGSTKIQVKETPNENVIRFDTSNAERLTIGATGQITAATGYVPSADKDLTTKEYVDDKVNLTSNANNSVDVNQTQADTFTVTVGGETEMTINTSGLALSNNTVRVGQILDEDTMSSDSATALATQQSIKAYVDAGLAGLVQNAISQGDSAVTVTDTGTNGTIVLTADNTSQLRITNGTIAAENGATFTGNLTGDVTGNLTGNVTGNVTGNLTGTASNADELDGLTSARFERRYPLSLYYRGATGITDEYFIVARKHPGTNTNATGVNGTFFGSRGSTGTGNNAYSCRINIQTAYTSTNVLEFWQVGSLFNGISEIEVDGVAYYALRGFGSGGEFHNYWYFQGHVIDNISDGNMLAKVRASDANVTVITDNVYTSYTRWNSDNDGAGSGLDADLWDGQQFADYLNQSVKTDASPTFVGLTVNGTPTFNNGLGNGSGEGLIVNGSGDIRLSEGGSVFFGAYDYSGGTYIRGFDAGNQLDFYSAGTRSMYMTNGGVTVNSLTETSSIAVKENIDPITGALSIVDKLKGYVYDRTDTGKQREAGLIAEEVDKILPNVVSKNADGEAEGIQYTKIIAYLVESIKELKTEIENLKGGK